MTTVAQPTYEQLLQQIAEKDALIARQAAELAQKDEVIESKDKALRKRTRESLYLQKWQAKTRDIMTNGNASPAFRALSWAQLDMYPDAVLNGRTVHVDVEAVRRHVGIRSKATAATYFKATNEVGGAHYEDEGGQSEKSGKFFTDKQGTFTPDFGTAALNASKAVQKVNEDERKRQAAKKLEASVCSRCGKPHSRFAVLPVCDTCQEVDYDAPVQYAEVGTLFVEPRQEPEAEEKNAPVPDSRQGPAAAAGNVEAAEASQFSAYPIPDEDNTPCPPAVASATHSEPEPPDYLDDIPMPTDSDAPEPDREPEPEPIPFIRRPLNCHCGIRSYWYQDGLQSHCERCEPYHTRKEA